MKKWLNIKPKAHDFSEDEVDTETESEDDGMHVQHNSSISTRFLVFLSLLNCFMQFAAIFTNYSVSLYST